MAESTLQIAATLNHLTEICKDGENGFRAAAEGVKDMNLKSLFNRYSAQRAQFAQELQSTVARLGRSPETAGSAAGALHRSWMNIKAVVSGHDEAAIIAEVERGEDAAKETYQQALKRDLPSDIRTIIQNQYTQVQDAHDHVRALEIKTQH